MFERENLRFLVFFYAAMIYSSDFCLNNEDNIGKLDEHYFILCVNSFFDYLNCFLCVQRKPFALNVV